MHILPTLTLTLTLLLAATMPASAPAQQNSTWWRTLPDGRRLFTECPLDTTRPRILVIYATPNGNSIEQTLGSRPENKAAWRFDIQHVAAQVRRVRQLRTDVSIALSVIEAPERSWPAYLSKLPDAPATTMRLVQYLRAQTEADEVILCGHSGGGSFLLRCMAAGPIPQYIRRIVFLDASYSWDNSRHAQPVLQWLQGNPQNHLLSIAYDDRHVELNGRRVVGDDGGTWRATERMVEGLGGRSNFTEESLGPFTHLTAINGQVHLLLHTNPQNQILHTALVGDMNGLICSLTDNPNAQNTWQRLLQPRDYEALVPESPQQATPVNSIAAADAKRSEPAVELPPRNPKAADGTQFLKSIESRSQAEREQSIISEFLQGNVPPETRRLIPLQIHATTSDGRSLAALCFVTSDCLAIGSEQDSVRLALTPGAALTLAGKLGCLLITPRISDAINDAATARLTPQPMTAARESLATLLQHQKLIQQQLLKQGSAGGLVTGAKKDLVLARRLLEHPGRVALYGWHQPDGLPIQPLYSGHTDKYVDYSHGVRLMHNQLFIDGRHYSAAAVLADQQLWPLLSHEGPLDVQKLVSESGWQQIAPPKQE